MPAPKSPTRINIWRHEVSSCASATDLPSPQKPKSRQPSIFKRILKRRARAPDGDNANQKGEKEQKTEMYDGGRDETGERRSQEDADSSMALGSGESDVVNEGLRARKERLERAARLLNGNGQRGQGKTA
jgi:hypothetical protein